MIKASMYRVTFAKAPEYDAFYEITLSESGAFQYGNQTCVEVKRNGQRDELIDTRYEKGIIGNFDEWCDNYLKSKFNPDFEPQIVKMGSMIPMPGTTAPDWGKKHWGEQ